VHYLATCIYALTSRSHPDDRAEAFRQLSRALRMGFGHDRLAWARDLAPLRGCPRFHELSEAAQTIFEWKEDEKE
jgi:hypothetical protein